MRLLLIFLLWSNVAFAEAVNPNPFSVPGQEQVTPTSPPVVTPPTTEPPVVIVPAEESILGTLLVNVLPLVLSAMGLTLTPQLILILQKLLNLLGANVQAKLLAQLKAVVTHGVAGATADGAKSPEQLINKVFAFTVQNAGHILKKMGVASANHLPLIEAIMHDVIASGVLPQPVAQGPSVEARLDAIEKRLEALHA